MRPAVSFRVGAGPRPRRFGPVTATDIVRFAGAGGDFNPIHHDEAAARAAGFEGVIAMGQFSAGLLAGLLTDWIGIENLRAFEVRFVAPVRIGDTLCLTAEVTAVTEEAVVISLTAAVGDVPVVAATARAAVAPVG